MRRPCAHLGALEDLGRPGRSSAAGGRGHHGTPSGGPPPVLAPGHRGLGCHAWDGSRATRLSDTGFAQDRRAAQLASFPPRAPRRRTRPWPISVPTPGHLRRRNGGRLTCAYRLDRGHPDEPMGRPHRHGPGLTAVRSGSV